MQNRNEESEEASDCRSVLQLHLLSDARKAVAHPKQGKRKHQEDLLPPTRPKAEGAEGHRTDFKD